MKPFFAFFCAVSLGLSACSSSFVTESLRPSPPLRGDATVVSPARSPRAQLRSQGQHLALQLSLADAGFRTQALPCAEVAYARVSITGLGLETPLYADQADSDHLLPMAGCTLNTAFSSIPYGLRGLNVTLFDSERAPLPTATLDAVFELNATPLALALSFRQGPTARVVEALLQMAEQENNLEKAFFAQHLDLAALQTTVDGITGVSGTGPHETYTTHPTLVDTLQLANDLFAGSVNADLSVYRLQGGSLTIAVTGLLGTDELEVLVGDAASQPLSVGSSGAILTGITPGTDLPIRVRRSGNAVNPYTYTPSLTTINAVEGQSSGTLVIAAAPLP